MLNENDDMLELSCTFNDGHYYLPWQVNLNGIIVAQTTNVEINHFIDSIFPSFLKKTDRVKLLHKLAKDLYETHLENAE